MISGSIRPRLSFETSSIRRCRISPLRTMATIKESIPHEVRTAAEPREEGLEAVIIANVKEVNDNVSSNTFGVPSRDRIGTKMLMAGAITATVPSNQPHNKGARRSCSFTYSQTLLSTSSVVQTWPVARHILSRHTKGWRIHNYINSEASCCF